MFVNLNGEAVELEVANWNPQKAVLAFVEDDKDKQLLSLVRTDGIKGVAELLDKSEEEVRESVDAAKQRAVSKRLDEDCITVFELMDELGYLDKEVAEILGMQLREVRRKYWKARTKLRGVRHHQRLMTHIPSLKLRDFAAFELHVILGVSIRKISRHIGHNSGHMTRRINNVAEMIKTACETETPGT